MKTANSETARAGMAEYGSLPIKKSVYWNARRRYVSKSYFETIKSVN